MTPEKTNFDSQPTLAGDRVTVRPITTTDWDGMFAFVDRQSGDMPYVVYEMRTNGR